MTMEIQLNSLNLDRPLSSATALDEDKLGRGSFAKAAVRALKRVSSTTGFVLSIEGPWGSGKTSTLAMIQNALLADNSPAPIMVHFNPWVVGDRDALLRQFLESIASAIKLTDNVGNAKKAAKELRNYSKVFDLMKYIPGAEPWASIIKDVLEASGGAVDAASEQKYRDIEGQKERVEKELAKLDRPILVFIDDVDRLFPLEVFEMVRIIKAVGDLPNVGYVVAWDSAYVTKSLESASVPNSANYLDKVIQIRLPLPAISTEARLRLLNSAIESLDNEALSPLFSNQQERLDSLYYYGLKEVLEQPRDITRVFNTVSVIEPGLRGEIVFADIVGLATLMVKAPTVYSLLRTERSVFVDRVPDDGLSDAKAKREYRVQALERAFNQCDNPSVVKQLTSFLFPNIAKLVGKFVPDAVRDMEGHIGAPGRLSIALQQNVGIGDVSLVDAKNFMTQPDSRADIIDSLTVENSIEFLEKLASFSASMNSDQKHLLDSLVSDVSRLPDSAPFSLLSKNRQAFALYPEDVALGVIDKLVAAVDASRAQEFARRICQDPRALSMASDILLNGWKPSRSNSSIVCGTGNQPAAVASFVRNIISALANGTFWDRANPALILWAIARVAPESGPPIYDAMVKDDPSLDKFVIYFLKHSFSSDGGQAYSLPEDAAILDVFLPLAKLKKHAKKRLADATLQYPERAAWRSISENETIYGRDGRVARR